jgi:hypothetical protein
MSGLFLHASWRSAGTWIWEKLRAQPGYMGFYEPLHEVLPRITPSEIKRLHENNWQSRHPSLSKPYFSEYQQLLNHGGANRRRIGVRNANAAFCFDQYFMNGTETSDRLYRYISGLCEAAYATNRQPVLKFTRTQGRLAWFVRHFPDVKNPLLVRQPWAKFRSAWRCLQEDGNPYFFAAPMVVLERNAANIDVANFIRALELPIRSFRPGTAQWRLRQWKQAVAHTDHVVLYKALFTLWILSVAYALPHADGLFDGDDAPETLAAAFGFEFVPHERPPARMDADQPNISVEQVKAIHETALATLKSRVDRSVLEQIVNWVAVAEAAAAVDLMDRKIVPATAPYMRRFGLGATAIGPRSTNAA